MASATPTRETTIGVIDDDPSIRRAIRRLLSSIGLQVECFASAMGVLQSNRLGSLDCLILDARMPEMSGLELQQEIIACGYAIPIIFMSAYDDVWARATALAGGAVAYLGKPFADGALQQAIHEALKSCDS